RVLGRVGRRVLHLVAHPRFLLSMGRAAYRPGPRRANREAPRAPGGILAGPGRGGDVIERIDAPEGVVAFKAVGTVEAADYGDVLAPAVEEAMAGGKKVRIVFVLGPEFSGYSAGAAWEDAKLWAPHLTGWERCAVVTDHTFLGDTI